MSTISASTTSTTAYKVTADTTGTLVFQTGASPTTAVTIDTSQNVGIGTSSPNSYGAGYTVAQVTGSSGGLVQVSSGTVTGEIQANSSTSGMQIGSRSNHFVMFKTNDTERARIDSSGNLLVGYTSGGSSGVAGIVKAVGYNTKAGTGASLNTNNFNINFGTGAQLWIDTTNLGTFSFTSDYRIKKDIQTQTLSALDRVLQLRPVTYEFGDYKDLFKADGVAREGFIAHELQAVIPSAVDGEKDAEDQIQSLRLDALCSVLTKAIQELKAELDAAKADIATLKGAE